MLRASATQRIERPVDEVRAQFADVAHHEAHPPHATVRFEVIEDDGAGGCRYRQVSKLGPVTLRQEMEMTETAPGVLENRVIKGQMAGGVLRFTIVEAGEGVSAVTAELEAPLNAVQRVAQPLLQRQVAKALAAALEEDRRDLESGTYDSHRG
jgi:hypothetical protein